MRGVIIGSALLLAACGGAKRMDEAPDRTAKPAKVAQTRGNPGIIHAMDQVPASERGLFQKALACEVRRNAAKRQPALVITPQYLTDLHARLRKDRRMAAC